MRNEGAQLERSNADKSEEACFCAFGLHAHWQSSVHITAKMGGWEWHGLRLLPSTEKEWRPPVMTEVDADVSECTDRWAATCGPADPHCLRVSVDTCTEGASDGLGSAAGQDCAWTCGDHSSELCTLFHSSCSGVPRLVTANCRADGHAKHSWKNA